MTLFDHLHAMKLTLVLEPSLNDRTFKITLLNIDNELVATTTTLSPWTWLNGYIDSRIVYK